MRKAYAIYKVMTHSGKGNHKVSPFTLLANCKEESLPIYWGASGHHLNPALSISRPPDIMCL